MVFVLDNYDSFTYNLVQYMGELGAEMIISRNDQSAFPSSAILPARCRSWVFASAIRRSEQPSAAMWSVHPS
jgi:anthranilate/para-aminobenzoate synthase component II